MVTPVSEPAPDEPSAAMPRPSALYWAGLALLIFTLLGLCGTVVIIAAFHP